MAIPTKHSLYLMKVITFKSLTDIHLYNQFTSGLRLWNMTKENVSGCIYMELYQGNKFGRKLPSTIPNLETNLCAEL